MATAVETRSGKIEAPFRWVAPRKSGSGGLLLHDDLLNSQAAPLSQSSRSPSRAPDWIPGSRLAGAASLCTLPGLIAFRDLIEPGPVKATAATSGAACALAPCATALVPDVAARS